MEKGASVMIIGRHSLIFGLSYALDILGKNNLSHSKSTAYLSVEISREMKLGEDEDTLIYYAALLHDIGIGDDFTATQEYLVSMKKHCSIGDTMLKRLPLPKTIPEYVLYHHEHYDGSGAFGLLSGDIPIGAQIICLASAFDDLFGKSKQFDRALILKVYNWLEQNRHLFSEEITGAFGRLINREYFLLDYFNHETKYALSGKIVVNDRIYYGTGDVEKFALCFADIIDTRSPFTSYHSKGIAELARKAATHLGYNSETQNKMYIAGLLHDIGKLHVSTDILHKNGKLTPEERFEMNKHTYFTRKILGQIRGFEEIVEIAANHHEKLDGNGYPYHITGDKLSELERVMSICDVYQALTEERPYRGKLPSEKVWAIIDGMTENNHLDKSLVEQIKLMF